MIAIRFRSIAIESDGTMPGNNGGRPTSESYLGEALPPVGAPC
jgi:hypothetical protein